MFLGCHLACALIERGHETAIFTHGRSWVRGFDIHSRHFQSFFETVRACVRNDLCHYGGTVVLTSVHGAAIGLLWQLWRFEGSAAQLRAVPSVQPALGPAQL